MKKILLPLVLSTLASFAQAATLVVDSTDDSLTATSGTCTLRGAVASVNAGSDQGGCTADISNAWGTNDTIKFDPSLAGETIDVKTAGGGQIAINKSLIIEGLVDTSGNPDITLDANSQNRFFHIPNPAALNLKITGVKFINGNANPHAIPRYGGVILVASSGPPAYTLTLEHCTFQDNYAQIGGVMFTYYTTDTVNINNSNFSGNQSTGLGGGGGGGAIHTGGTTNISNSNFSNNTSPQSDAGAVLTNVANINNSNFSGNTALLRGGAVYAYASSNISNSNFSNNVANAIGGAVYASSNTNISNSTFSSNTADGIYSHDYLPNHDYGNGGAVYVRGTSAILNIRDSTFSNNLATNAVDNTSYNDGNGGAVYALGTANISNSTFSGNQAKGSTAASSVSDGNGGAVYVRSSLTARHLTLLGNTAVRSGQALYASFNTATLHNSIFIGTDNNNAQCAGYISSSGSYNLEGWADTSGNWQASATTCGSFNSVTVPPSVSTLGDIIAPDLADNGGPTPTLALPAGSPAIDAAGSGTYSQMLNVSGSTWSWVDATLDQRGSARVAASIGRDVGAYESNDLTITGTLPDGVVGDSYTGSVSASNGTSPYSYTLGNGSSLPPGLSLAADGTISGTPMQDGIFNFTIIASDNSSPTLFASQSFTITITTFTPPPPASGTPIPALPASLLLALAAAVGLLGRRRLRQGA